MAEFPASPIPPRAFFEDWLPKAFAAAELPEEARRVETRLGVLIHGPDGGEWVFQVQAGELSVEPGSREETAFTLVQSVEDWRGCLWEGRGGAIGKQAATLYKPAAVAAAPPPGQAGQLGQLGGPPSPAMLEQLQKLDGSIRMVVTGGQGGDWAMAFKLGPGPIPEEPTATLTLTSEDATAMERGELDPMAAFLSGRILVVGDMTIVMQMQAIQMQAAMGTTAGSA